MRHLASDRALQMICYAVLGVWSIVALAPLYWLFITSLKLRVTIGRGLTYIPWVDFQPVLTNWRAVLITRPADLVAPLTNSLIVALSAATLAVFFGAMAGYGLARFRYRVLRLGSDGIALWFIGQRLVPPFLLILPLLILYRGLGLLDTHLGLILAYTVFNLPLAVWITRDSFASLPRDVEESALIDGCSRWQAFLRMALPFSAPGLVAAFAICFIFTWNEYLIALMLTFKDAQTMPIYLAGHGYNAVLTILCILPPVLVGLGCERFLTRGLFSGAPR
jgi:multiple sugar transport system permease protein